MRQLLTESVLLAVLGGAAGIVLAYWSLEVVTALDLGLTEIARLEQASLEPVAALQQE